MVVIKEPFREFLKKVDNQRVLVFVSCDVDGVCAWSILRHLFRCYHVGFTLVSVSDKEDLRGKYHTYSAAADYVVFLGCGASFDVVQFLEVPDDSEKLFYVCDSHRPIHVNNFYNQKQVKLLCAHEDFSAVPNYDDIFWEMSEDEDENDVSDEEGDSPGPIRKRRRILNENDARRRTQKRQWEKKKNEIMADYQNFTYHATSASLVLFDLAFRLSHDTLSLLWYTIVAHTSLWMYQRHNRDHYLQEVDYLQDHMARLSHKANVAAVSDNANGESGEDSSTQTNGGLLRLCFQEDMTLLLYRHWSLQEAIDNSVITVTNFRLYTLEGKKKRDDLLALIGISRKEARQSYECMKSVLKENFVKAFLKYAEVIGIHRRDFLLPTFVLIESFSSEYSAMDMTLLCGALLECESSSALEPFQLAVDLLTGRNLPLLKTAMNLAQQQLKTITAQVENFMGSDEIVGFGPFFYVHVPETSLLAKYLSRPLSQQMLARYCLMAKVRRSRQNKRYVNTPLLLCTDFPDTSHVRFVGVPPLGGDSDKNLFWQAFEAAKTTTQSRMTDRSFDAHIVELHREDMFKFFEALASMVDNN